MKKFAIHLTFLLSVIFILFSIGATQERIPLLKNKPKIIDSLPNNYDKGVEMEIRKGDKSNMLKVIRYISPNSEFSGFAVEGGTVAFAKEIDRESYVELDAEKIKMAPNMTVNISSSESIISGSKGATLKRTKEGKSIILIKGDAYLLKRKY